MSVDRCYVSPIWLLWYIMISDILKKVSTAYTSIRDFTKQSLYPRNKCIQLHCAFKFMGFPVIPVVLEDLPKGRRHSRELAPEAGLRLGLRGQLSRVRVQEHVEMPLGWRAQQVQFAANKGGRKVFFTGNGAFRYAVWEFSFYFCLRHISNILRNTWLTYPLPE